MKSLAASIPQLQVKASASQKFCAAEDALQRLRKLNGTQHQSWIGKVDTYLSQELSNSCLHPNLHDFGVSRPHFLK
jgi:hypothetical protein